MSHHKRAATSSAAILVFVATLAVPASGQCDVESEEWLTSSEVGDQFGYALELEGHRLAIGAPGRTQGPDRIGIVELYAWDGVAWTVEASLTPAFPTEGMRFGASLDLDGDRLLVGSPRQGQRHVGGAYLYERTVNGWEESHRFAPTDAAFDQYGSSVAFAGQHVLIGSHDAEANEGAVAVFEVVGSTWTETQRLLPPDRGANHRFASSLAVADDDRLWIGAPNALDTGVVYGFELQSGLWTHTSTLKGSATQAGDAFGRSIAAARDRLVVGAPGEDRLRREMGAAYVFDWTGSAWLETAHLFADDSRFESRYGTDVALAGDLLLVHSDDDLARHHGATYVYRDRNGSWSIRHKLVPAADELGDTTYALTLDRGRIAHSTNHFSPTDRLDTVHVFTEVALDVAPDTVVIGDTLTFHLAGVPGERSLLVATAIDAQPWFAPLWFSRFDSHGLDSQAATVPADPALQGHTVSFALLSADHCYGSIITPSETVVFQ